MSNKVYNAFQAFKSLLTKIRGIRQWWLIKSPSEKFEAIRVISSMVCESIGIRIIRDQKIYWYTASCGVCAIIYFALDFYTIQYYLRQNEFVKIIECTYLFGIVIAVRLPH